jgi:predicted nucleic acid-binding protein
MKNILVDSSVWIEYFRGKKEAAVLDELIDRNQLCINNLILSELIPFLRIKTVPFINIMLAIIIF